MRKLFELKPLEPPYEKAIEDILAFYPKGKDDYLLKLFRLFANSPRFLSGKGVVNLLDKESPLPLQERELVILRVTANNRCEYEWGVHVAAFSHAAEISEQQYNATVLSDHRANCWSERQALLVQCVDQLCERARITDETLADFQAAWNAEQQLEIMALCGNYHLVSCVANTARLELEDTAQRFPK